MELAPALEWCCTPESGSKLRALQTLRVAGHLQKCSPFANNLDYSNEAPKHVGASLLIQFALRRKNLGEVPIALV